MRTVGAILSIIGGSICLLAVGGVLAFQYLLGGGGGGYSGAASASDYSSFSSIIQNVAYVSILNSALIIILGAFSIKALLKRQSIIGIVLSTLGLALSGLIGIFPMLLALAGNIVALVGTIKAKKNIK